MKPVVAIIQARMSSTRLPGKIMARICDKPILWHVTNRLKSAKLIDKIIVATSVDSEDDIVVSECAGWGVNTFRGSLEDVLDRYYQAALASRAKIVVRVTADCPLIDPGIVDAVIEKFKQGAFDLVGLKDIYPDGLDVEVFSFATLERAWREARLASEREHVTPYMINHKELFNCAALGWDKDLSYMRWTVDDPADLIFVTGIYEGLGCRDEIILTDEIIEFLKSRPELLEINSKTRRNEGYQRSLDNDKLLDERVTKED